MAFSFALSFGGALEVDPMHQYVDDPVRGLMANTYAVSAMTQLKPDTIRRYCSRFRIGRKFGAHWFLTVEEIDMIKSRMGKTGRPLAKSKPED